MQAIPKTNKVMNMEDVTPSIKVRKPNYTFPYTISKHWLDGGVFKTQFANALTLLFPDVEKFFVRVIKNYVPGNDNPKLRKEVLAFIGQETQHHIQHEKFWANLKDQGYDIDSFQAFFRKIAFEIVEPIHSEDGKLALTAGIEHYTALLSEVALENELFKHAEPEMKKLFEWHCAEEIEHKAVAFDILQDTNPNYILRIYGMILASILLMSFVSIGTMHLVIQDKKVLDLKFWQDALDFLFFKDRTFPKAFKIFLEYFKPDFHPNDRDTSYLLTKVELPKANVA